MEELPSYGNVLERIEAEKKELLDDHQKTIMMEFFAQCDSEKFDREKELKELIQEKRGCSIANDIIQKVLNNLNKGV